MLPILRNELLPMSPEWTQVRVASRGVVQKVGTLNLQPFLLELPRSVCFFSVLHRFCDSPTFVQLAFAFSPSFAIMPRQRG